MNKIRISAVSYTNTKPFVYGIQQSEELRGMMELSLDIPSDCARKLLEDKADLGLVPVAVLPDMPFYEIVGDYCIGASGAVNSVFLFSDRPLAQLRHIRLDPQSRTSNLLTRVLARNHWKIEPEFLDPLQEGDAEAFVLIGDRTFGEKEKHPYVYDLAAEWMDFSGLPFVFAVWAANKPLGSSFHQAFNRALKAGVEQLPFLLEQLPPSPGIDLKLYLTEQLSFELDGAKKKGLELFLHYLAEIKKEGLISGQDVPESTCN